VSHPVNGDGQAGSGALFVAHCRCSHLKRRNACGKQRLGNGDFSLARNATPGLCSPSRSVVSLISTLAIAASV
jgi:hypothetical protein